jgi:hypothetical protein
LWEIVSIVSPIGGRAGLAYSHQYDLRIVDVYDLRIVDVREHGD